MSRVHGSLTKDDEVNQAAWAAGRGALVGAAKWGIFSAIAGLVAFQYSPVYRGLTFQFKVFLQMSGMTAGSIIEADQRLRDHGAWQRRAKKVARDAEVWRRYEQEYEQVVQAKVAEEQQQQGQQQQGGGAGGEKRES